MVIVKHNFAQTLNFIGPKDPRCYEKIKRIVTNGTYSWTPDKGYHNSTNVCFMNLHVVLKG